MYLYITPSSTKLKQPSLAANNPPCTSINNSFQNLLQFTVGNTCLYNALQRMVLPTTEQICCTVGNTPLYRHFQPKLPPTVNCRNVHELPGLPSHPKGLPFPPRQWHAQPSPNTPPRHISCSTPKEMLRMAHKTAFGGPAGQLWCAIVLG